MSNKKRLTHIDIMESIAIFFVLTYHSTLYSFDFLNENTPLNYLLYFFRTILSTCVPLFFFVNGYLLFNRPFSMKKHVKKMIRIVFLVIFWAFALIPLYMFILGKPFSIKTVILSFLNLDAEYAITVFWYLGALICIYIFFPALKALFDSNKKHFIFFVAVCAVLTFGLTLANELLGFMSVVLQHGLGKINYPAIEMFNPFVGIHGYSFVYFCVGGLICTYEERIRSFSKVKRNLVSLIGIIISCSMLFLVGIFHSKFIDGKIWDIVWWGYDSVFTFLNVIFIYVLSLNYTKDNRFINTISQNTLGIYILHSLIIMLTRPLIKSYEFLCNIPVNLLYSFAILCVCLIVCLAIKKVPFLRKLV